MILLDEHRLPAYLRERGLLGPDEPCGIGVLSGGVSNLVLRAEPAMRAAFVVKQSRERLQTQVPWFSRLDRIFRETAMMETLRPLLPDGAIPRILYEDRENYVYAMQAVDPLHTVWKCELLAGAFAKRSPSASPIICPPFTAARLAIRVWPSSLAIRRFSSSCGSTRFIGTSCASIRNCVHTSIG